ncbi:DUF2244 domain-containing protein [Celeribacter neptunius]|uniref:Uncharacterized membrane protein n=1 Tax=Celeribacter neptunius TaxID=588602 RepID=A0A1I3P427_9RHOB|nr:DUF2244 domain-containing protein [Celeribacter neptunius]SFJ16303.1 Uncharacterized membrane protein [Celeribacter neptunius]
MPYLWTPSADSFLGPAGTRHDSSPPPTEPEDGAPLLRLELWPHRSLKGKGFSAAIWLMFLGGLIPIVPFIGTIAFWVLLIFMMTALTALWTALRRSDRDRLREELLIWHDRVTLSHWPEKGARLDWQANPYWLRLSLHPSNGKVEQYLTLKGGGPEHTREVELGAFLSPEERERLYDELSRVVGRLKTG